MDRSDRNKQRHGDTLQSNKYLVTSYYNKAWQMRTKGRRRPIAADPIAAADTVGTFAWIGIFQDLFDL